VAATNPRPCTAGQPGRDCGDL